jgi:hypothetical protein
MFGWTHLIFVFQEIDEVSNQILNAEEVLLEALCFDFVVDSPHADLVDLFETHDVSHRLQDYAWSIAHDSSVLSMPWLCSGCDVSGFQVPHSCLRPLPTENHRHCMLHSLSTDRRRPTFTVFRCPRVAIGTISVITDSSDTQGFFT